VEQRRRLLVPIALGFVAAAVVGFSVLVGFVGAPKHERFGWELASIFGTALGTTLLALATGALAWSTRSEVRATQQLAKLTKHDQDLREMPLWSYIPRDSRAHGTPAQSQSRCGTRGLGQHFVLRLGQPMKIRITPTSIRRSNQRFGQRSRRAVVLLFRFGSVSQRSRPGEFFPMASASTGLSRQFATERVRDHHSLVAVAA
jgi:hypothetical protein